MDGEALLRKLGCAPVRAIAFDEHWSGTRLRESRRGKAQG